MKTTTQITALAGITLLALAGCGDNDDTTEDADTTQETEQASAPDSADEVDAAEIEAQQEDEEVSELISRENELFEEWLNTEAESQEEAELEEHMEDIYDQLDEIWDYPETEDDVPNEFYDLAILQHILNSGGDISDILGPGFEAENGQADDQEGVAPRDRDFSDDPILADREFTGRMTGDVTTAPGEPVEIDEGVFEGIGNYMGDLTLTEMYAAYECETYSETVTPTHGDFLVATFTLEADADADSEWSISEDDFRWEGFDDHIATYEAWECQSANAGLTDPARPGETIERTYIFDIPEYEGTLTYRGATNYVSWEIERADYDNADRLPENAGDPAP